MSSTQARVDNLTFLYLYRETNMTTAAPKSGKHYPKESVVSLDELEVEDGFNTVKTKPVDDLVPSLQEVGLRNAIHVRHLENSELLFIIDGHRRYQAAKEAGLTKVHVVDHGYLSNTDARIEAMTQNLLRRKVSKKEVMDTVRYLDKEGMGGAEIGRRLSLAKSTVSEYLTLTRASPKLRKAAEKSTEEGGIPVKAALRAAKLTPAQQQRAAPKLAGKTSAEADEVLGPRKPRILTGPVQAAEPGTYPARGVLMPGESFTSGYRLVSDYKERCQKLEAEVKKRLTQTPSSQRLQGMELVIGVLRGKLTVQQAFTDWQKV